MQIKRFEAKNMTEALRQIKRQLGTEAVILSAKDIRKENRLLGISRKIGVEVTAAVDGGLAILPSQTTTRAFKQNAAAHGGRKPIGRPKASDPNGGGVQDLVRVGKSNTRPKAKGGGQAAGTERATPSSEVLSKPAPRCTAVLDPSLPDHADLRAHMHKRLLDGGLEVMPWPFSAEKSHTIALVGNAGVGKTTTIAKLAARLQHEEGHRVGLISLDHEKIGGVEQLQIYADILQIPLEVPRSDQALKKAIKSLAACDVVLVDTPAIGASKAKRPGLFDDQVRQIPDLRVWLVIGADNQVDNMRQAAATSDDLDISAVIVTKTDLSRRLEGVMQFLSAAALPVVGLSNGPDVPQDLTEASLDLFARLVLQSGTGGETNPRPEESPTAAAAEGPYLANRSSDIFHRSGCKWIRLINKENIVMFGSFAEALNHRFKPCRYCNPQHMSITGILSQEQAVQ